MATLPKTNIAPENRPGPKRKQSYSNHPFLGAMLVSGRVPLKNGGWETILSFWDGVFSGQTVSFREGIENPLTFSVAIFCWGVGNSI